MEDILPKKDSIAIIGMEAVFPKSNGLKAYWNLIFNGEDAITEIPEDSHWSLKDYFDEDPATPDHTYCKRGGFIPKINFDPSRYGFPPKNLEATDTSQLLGLMVAERALEDAGYPANTSNIDHSRTSVILGITGTQELVIPLGARLYHPHWKRALQDCGVSDEKCADVIQRISDSFPKWQENSFPGLLGNVVAGRIANRLNLGGTNIVVDAACASSLSAIHTACLELVSNRCDISVSGGVDTLNDIFMHMCFSKTGVLSHTSDVRPFSKDADGTVLGEGIGMVVLKRLEDAKRDNDKIYAVIKGIGTSSDGKTGGIYAPDAGGQLRALKSAYADAKIDPCTVELFEAHGTGTRVGDKIELTALKSLIPENRLSPSDSRAFIQKNKASLPANSAAIGSVKSMIGHAKAAAGAAGLIKAVLSLHHKVIPPTLKAQSPDPEIDITNSPFYLNPLSKPWVKSSNHPRRCGVSAFGFGGSNFHAVLEEYSQTKDNVSWDGSVQIAAFSSNTKEQLIKDIKNFKESMDSCKDWDSGEIAQMLAWESVQSRSKFLSSDQHRVLIAINNNDNPAEKAADALNYLEKLNDTVNVSISADSSGPHSTKENKSDKNGSGIFYGTGKPKGNIGFLFPGQGSQYAGMGRELISMFPEALKTLETACETFSASYSKYDSVSESDVDYKSLKDYLFPPPSYAQNDKISEEKLRATDIAQPAIGAVSLAMVKILERFGIKPHAACGHSFGELTAMCAAEWIDDKTFFNLACARGKYMAGAASKDGDPGTMFAVKASLDHIEQLIKSENLNLVVANRNSQDQVVLSGRTDEIKRAAKILKKHKIRGVQLTVAAAFHSALVQDAVKPFKKIVNDADINFSQTEVFSNTTGQAYPKEHDKVKKLLGEQLVNPVHFMSDIESMFNRNIKTFIEVGPKTVLSSLTRTILDGKEALSLSVDGSSGNKRGVEDLAHLLCTLAASGFEVMLDKWENIIEKPAKKMMRVPLTGANVKPVLQSCKPQAKKSSQQKQSPQLNLSTVQTESIQQVATTPTTKFNPTSSLNVNQNPVAQNSSLVKKQVIEQDTPVIQHNRLNSSYRPQPKGTDMKNQHIPHHQITVATDPYKTVKRDNMPESHSSLIHSAMQMVQKGMESMQELQTRTALAHEKFLDTQSVASRTLQSMMEQTRFFAENAIFSLNNRPCTPSINNTEQIKVERPAQIKASHVKEDEQYLAYSRSYQAEESVNTYSSEHFKAQEPELSGTKSKDNAVTSKNNGKNHSQINSSNSTLSMNNYAHQDENFWKQKQNSHINNQTGRLQTETLLLETVSKLTGFPVEMLSLDMDIESDLGIDSIKRVEIVSELEKQLPGAAALSPDNMGTLRTLKDICLAITPADQPPVAQQVSTTYIPAHRTVNHKNIAASTTHITRELPVNGQNDADTEPDRTQNITTTDKNTVTGQNVMQVLMETISTLTGFPVEMLTPDMDIESDLGIDSIKRVEILSKLEEKLPQANSISPDDLGQLKTIRQIAQHITGSNDLPESDCKQNNFESPDSVSESKTEIVASEKKNF